MSSYPHFVMLRDFLLSDGRIQIQTCRRLGIHTMAIYVCQKVKDMDPFPASSEGKMSFKVVVTFAVPLYMGRIFEIYYCMKSWRIHGGGGGGGPGGPDHLPPTPPPPPFWGTPKLHKEGKRTSRACTRKLCVLVLNSYLDPPPPPPPPPLSEILYPPLEVRGKGAKTELQIM